MVASNYIYSSSTKKPTIRKRIQKSTRFKKVKIFKIAMELTKAMNNFTFQVSIRGLRKMKVSAKPNNEIMLGGAILWEVTWQRKDEDMFGQLIQLPLGGWSDPLLKKYYQKML